MKVELLRTNVETCGDLARVALLYYSRWTARLRETERSTPEYQGGENGRLEHRPQRQLEERPP